MWKIICWEQRIYQALLTHKGDRHKTVKCDIRGYCKSQKDTLPTWNYVWMYQMWQRVQIKPNIQRHYQTHNENKVKAFKCFICEKYFEEKYNFRQHINNIHHDINRLCCEPCGKIFKKKCMLNFHIEIKHPDPNMPCPEWSCEIFKKPYPHSRAL